MGDRKGPFHIVDYKRLGIFYTGSSRCGIAHMPHAEISFQTAKIFFIEHVIDMSQPLS